VLQWKKPRKFLMKYQIYYNKDERFSGAATFHGAASFLWNFEHKLGVAVEEVGRFWWRWSGYCCGFRFPLMRSPLRVFQPCYLVASVPLQRFQLPRLQEIAAVSSPFYSPGGAGTVARYEQEIWANAHETRDSISLISYAGCLGLSPVYFSENSL